MKTEKINGVLKAIIVAGILALTLTACDNAYGVFHEIQTEKAQVGTDVFKNATVKAIAEDATNYYAAMARVFYKPVGGGLWLVLPVNGSSDYYCAGFAADGASIYVAAAEKGATTTLKGIYKGTVGGTSWSAIDATAIGAKTVDALFWAGSDLFALAHVESTGIYSLYYSNGTTAFASTGLTALTSPVLGVAHDGATYWALVSSTTTLTAKIYSGTAAALTTDSTPAGGKNFVGIAVDSSNKVLATTTDGYLYTYSAGWTSAVASSDVELGVLAEVQASPTQKRLILGKYNSGYGYYEYIASSNTLYNGNDADNAAFVPTASSYTTTIYTKPVRAMYYSATHSKLFIGLAAQGTDTYALYSNTYDPTAASKYWSGWTAE